MKFVGALCLGLLFLANRVESQYQTAETTQATQNSIVQPTLISAGPQVDRQTRSIPRGFEQEKSNFSGKQGQKFGGQGLSKASDQTDRAHESPTLPKYLPTDTEEKGKSRAKLSVKQPADESPEESAPAQEGTGNKKHEDFGRKSNQQSQPQFGQKGQARSGTIPQQFGQRGQGKAPTETFKHFGLKEEDKQDSSTAVQQKKDRPRGPPHEKSSTPIFSPNLRNRTLKIEDPEQKQKTDSASSKPTTGNKKPKDNGR